MAEQNPPNLITNAANLVSNVVNQFIVRPTGAPNLIGISGFVFDVIDEEELFMDSDITDHYVEDNFSVQDHISLKPLRFSLRGFVGELNNLFPTTTGKVITTVQTLGRIVGFLPEFTTQAKQVYNNIKTNSLTLNNATQTAESAYSLFKQFSTSSARQQNSYSFFYSMWASRQLCVVETPWTIYQNMAIESVRVVQGAVTRYVSDFVITFKQIRTASTKILFGNINSSNPEGSGTVDGRPMVSSGRLNEMLSVPDSLGTIQGSAQDFSLMTNSFSNGVFGGGGW